MHCPICMAPATKQNTDSITGLDNGELWVESGIKDDVDSGGFAFDIFQYVCDRDKTHVFYAGEYANV